MPLYFLVYKPFGVLSQFSGDGDTLKTLYDFPSDVYPVGRLDKDSEGLLLVTNDKALNHYLLDPKYGHIRTYWVQVEGEITPQAISALERGVRIKVGQGYYVTKKAKADFIAKEPNLPPRNPPIRFRKNVPESWISLSLTEGKNRQVRKMTAAVGFPTLRLVRWGTEKLSIEGFGVGEVRILSQAEVLHGLQLEPGTLENKNKKQNRSSR
ncbi:pseudouridine synthase [Pleomorphovibrio marinus]|uniref:pseudouridine synthase n=1 Tax=Pleomorphovibrio marinus TaxID=2164132 RepID=UPI000E0BB66B|nr:pseudouridine synthase [Pleomorphovibrio marinus]